MTGRHHNSGTERCREAAELLAARGEPCDVVINIQGDEPFIDPRQIAQVADCFLDPGTRIATLIKNVAKPDELEPENVVKVVTDLSGHALFFSRSVIPFVRGMARESWTGETTYYRHIGIYGYRTDTLAEIVTLPATRLEKAESLEQLRWLEHGYRIMTQITEYESFAIDSPADLLKITNSGGTLSR